MNFDIQLKEKKFVNLFFFLIYVTIIEKCNQTNKPVVCTFQVLFTYLLCTLCIINHSAGRKK